MIVFAVSEPLSSRLHASSRSPRRSRSSLATSDRNYRIDEILIAGR